MSGHNHTYLPNGSSDEKQLLLKLVERDVAAYSWLHDRYYNSLVYFSFGIIQNQQQAEDIAVESLVKMWQSSSDFETLGKLRAYLFTLVRNASFNYLKYQKVREKGSEQFRESQEIVNSQLEALLIESDLIRLVYKEVEQLQEKYKTVIELLYFQDMPPADVANQLGISMENLRQRKSRALEKLKNLLIKKGIDGRVLSIIFFKPVTVRSVELLYFL